MKNIVANEGINWNFVVNCGKTAFVCASYGVYKVSSVNLFGPKWSSDFTFEDAIINIWTEE